MKWCVLPTLLTLIACGRSDYVDLEIKSDLSVGEQTDELSVTVSRYRHPDDEYLDESYSLNPSKDLFPIHIIFEVVREPPDFYQFVVAASKEGEPVSWGGKVFSMREGYLNQLTVELTRAP